MTSFPIHRATPPPAARRWLGALAGRLFGRPIVGWSSSGQGACRGATPPGIVVVGHGTADPTGAEETRRVAALVAGMLPDMPVELGFLEVIGPGIGDALAKLASQGCREVVVAPLLLFTAGHATRDVPDAIRETAARWGLAVRQAAAIGCHPAAVALSRRRREEAVAGLGPVPDERTLLLFVGRGASAPTAFDQLHEFARAAAPAASRVDLGFVAAARPTLAEAVARAAESGARRVVVQPHLLFRGHVEEQVTAAVEAARRDHPGIEWVQVCRLGADPLVAEAVAGRVRDAWAAGLPTG